MAICDFVPVIEQSSYSDGRSDRHLDYELPHLRGLSVNMPAARPSRGHSSFADIRASTQHCPAVASAMLCHDSASPLERGFAAEQLIVLARERATPSDQVWHPRSADEPRALIRAARRKARISSLLCRTKPLIGASDGCRRLASLPSRASRRRDVRSAGCRDGWRRFASHAPLLACAQVASVERPGARSRR